ncbi:AAA family ATPase [Vibrio sp. 10N.261.51.A1]|uniref:AAA family ATPase n=1 Tax=unclassified Vibrio TaxID=2614977 RepID=UPI0035538316
MVDFSNLSLISAGELVDTGTISSPDFVLRGLESSHVGMLIAAPEMGKSHLCFSIAIEHSTQLKLLGISPATKPQKTLLISAEDSVAVIKKHLTKKLNALPGKFKKLARANIYPFSATLPFVTPAEAPITEQNEVLAYTNKLIELIKENGISLVIIDTVSEVIGQCDEVKHDRLIKSTFQRIARESRAAILLVHHVNKAEIKGDSEISMASGAGLTTVMRLSKLIMAVVSEKNESKKLSFLKANYLTQEEKKTVNLKFVDSILINSELGVCFQKEVVNDTPERPKPLVVKRKQHESKNENNNKRSIRGAF